MTRDETIALWEKCEKARAAALAKGEPAERAHEAAKHIWNEWAKGQLRKRELLNAERKFKLGKFQYVTSGFVAPETIAENDATARWLEEARVDFHATTFEYKPNFGGFLFPSQTIFGESKWATKNRTIRPSVTFTHGADFSYAHFFLDAVFDWSHFGRAAIFSEVKFSDIARFDQCLFEGTAWFHQVEFASDVWMGQVKFYGHTAFEKATFKGDTSFYGAESKGAFILKFVEFAKIPDFTQVQFQGAPRIDNIRWPKIGFFPGLTNEKARDLAARYRAIRQLATIGQDHENEAKAFEGEIRSKRGAINRWYQPAFCYGVLYDLFSDFGRSTLRPLLAWTLVIIAFAAFYLSQTEVMQQKLELQDVTYVLAAAKVGSYALSRSSPCYAPNEKPSDPNQMPVDGLSEKAAQPDQCARRSA